MKIKKAGVEDGRRGVGSGGLSPQGKCTATVQRERQRERVGGGGRTGVEGVVDMKGLMRARASLGSSGEGVRGGGG